MTPIASSRGKPLRSRPGRSAALLGLGRTRCAHAARRCPAAATARWRRPQQADHADQPIAAERQDDHRDQASGDRRQRHLAEIAGEIVGAERAARARSLVSRGNEARCDRVLGARADAAENECDRQHSDARACSEKQISSRGHGGAGREHPRSADPLRQLGCRDLETRHHAGIERAQYADCGVAQRELRLPHRQQQIERIGQAVMQRMGAAGDPEHACSVSGSGCRGRCGREGGDRHDAMLSRRGHSARRRSGLKTHLASVTL